ncbi:antibiotic biosynthesis monooxygenase [Cohnella sp. 56]|uniref:antibiotic biosynthesis monooxygenase n=1 Tax=Cohnella sp. 56 TaxID=3113722 RepID=UPI0030E755E7
MIVAINTIKIKSGHVSEVAERFKNPKGIQHAAGFVRMELLTESLEAHDELKVCTTWEDRAAFDDWVNSDAFKQAHTPARPKPAAEGGEPGQHRGGDGEQARPGGGIMLGAKLSVHEVVFAYPSE